MPFVCLSPLLLHRDDDGNLVRPSRATRADSVPCGRCDLCIHRSAGEWSNRLIWEAQGLNGQAFAVTLTYANDQLPRDGSVDMEGVRAFIKRLRSRLDYHQGKRLRYFVAAEYSPAPSFRPHYHGCIYGFWPSDAVSMGGKGRSAIWTSPLVEGAWGHGHIAIQELTPGTARYVAGHAMSKLTPQASIPPGLAPAGRCMSQGLGRDFYARFGGDLRRVDFAVIDGQRVPLPRYFDKLTERLDPLLLDDLKAERQRKALDRPDSRDPARLRAKAEILRSRRAQKPRKAL